MRLNDPSAEERARPIRMLLFDADGVMTDGRLLFAPDGSEWKSFDSKDGLGLKIAREQGLLTGVITGRRSGVLERRAQELRFEEIHQGVIDKGRVIDAVLARRNLHAQDVAYLGDDLVDVPAMRRVGLAIAPADAVPDVLRHAHAVTERRGGRGALREAVEFILRAQGRWDAVLKSFGAV